VYSTNELYTGEKKLFHIPGKIPNSKKQIPSPLFCYLEFGAWNLTLWVSILSFERPKVGNLFQVESQANVIYFLKIMTHSLFKIYICNKIKLISFIWQKRLITRLFLYFSENLFVEIFTYIKKIAGVSAIAIMKIEWKNRNVQQK